MLTTSNSRREGVLGNIAMSFTVLTLLAGPLPIRVQAGSDSRRSAVVEAVEKVQRAVVSISSEKKAASHSRWPFSAEENQVPRVSGMGSGVLIDPRGYILTNHHVVDKVQGIVVQLFDGTTYPARVLQFDAVMDLAIVKVDPDHSLAAIKVGTSSDLMVGETVITIGNAYGYENTVSVGIVSALHRDVTLSDEQVYRNLIQTDACINPGNSGGPLINVDGELIGINVAVRAGAQGIGFALPIDEVKEVAAEMISSRRLTGAWHGLVASEQHHGSKRRVVVSEVQTGSPAEAAGFKSGDEIVRVDELAVSSPLDLERGMLDIRPGHPAKVAIRRGNAEKTVPLDVRIAPGAVAATPAGRSRRRRLAAAGHQDPTGFDRIRRSRLAKAAWRALRPIGFARKSGLSGRDSTRRHPGRHERRHPPVGNHPSRQHPLRPPPAGDEPERKARCSTSFARTESNRAGSPSPNPAVRSVLGR